MINSTIVAVVLFGVAAGVPGCWRLPGGSVATISVSAVPRETMQGFGASGAWWPNDLVHFPGKDQERVADLLFGPRGIGLSAYRYNIGGGGVGVAPSPRAPATFLVQPGTYDWSRDPGGMRFLRLAADHGVGLITGFVNSAPAPWTTNHRSCGGSLVPGDEAAYASYLAAVVRHLRQADGITVSYVSPMNEPDNSFASCGQEGMAVPVGERAGLVQAVGKALAAGAPWAHVIADESSLAYYQALPEVPQWLGTPGTAPQLAAIAHHTYEFPTDAMLHKVATLGTRFDKPLWMTEICCYDGKGLFGFGQQYDPTMTSGMWLANTIWSDLSSAHDSAFYWWTAVSSALGCDPEAQPTCVTTKNSNGWNDGLLYYDPNYLTNHDYRIFATKRFWTMGNFSRYVRPGAVRHDTTGAPAGVQTLAFSKGDTWTVVAIDNAAAGSPPAAVGMKLPASEGRLVTTGAVQTSSSRDLAHVRSPARRGDGTFVAHLPAQSVTTFTFEARPGGSKRG